MEQAEINTKARNALETYEVVDDTCRICYVDGYEDGYNQALEDNPILQDIADGKAIIVDKGWLEQHDKQMIDKACEWLQEHLFCTVKTDVDNIIDVCSRDVFLDDFKKAMED